MRPLWSPQSGRKRATQRHRARLPATCKEPEAENPTRPVGIDRHTQLETTSHHNTDTASNPNVHSSNSAWMFARKRAPCRSGTPNLSRQTQRRDARANSHSTCLQLQVANVRFAVPDTQLGVGTGDSLRADTEPAHWSPFLGTADAHRDRDSSRNERTCEGHRGSAPQLKVAKRISAATKCSPQPHLKCDVTQHRLPHGDRRARTCTHTRSTNNGAHACAYQSARGRVRGSRSQHSCTPRPWIYLAHAIPTLWQSNT